MTRPISRTMYSGSSARLGSFVTPLRLSVLTWYWSMIHSSAERPTLDEAMKASEKS